MKIIPICDAFGIPQIILDIFLKHKDFNSPRSSDSFKPIFERIFGFEIFSSLNSLLPSLKGSSLYKIQIWILNDAINRPAFTFSRTIFSETALVFSDCLILGFAPTKFSEDYALSVVNLTFRIKHNY